MARRRAAVARVRATVMVLVGGGVAVAVGLLDSWRHAPAAGWAAAAGIYVVWVWLTISPMDAETTAAHSTEEDPQRRLGNFLTMTCALASLVAVAIVMADAHTATPNGRLALGGLALSTTILSWLMMHLLFTLRYAQTYYDTPPPGGIDFNQTQPPRYTDFAYISLSFGTAYCVSDTAITSSDVRAETLRHTLLSFVFANGILATTINLVVSLASGS
ncbi:DUF1345 domain-containing protein [Tsukamurella tyrosinosolvens]|uniref:DUF1345 domain-containing protein n=1 Tax=Tsukamurella tyrosinosolvens TaxID=57704 RepID=UPI0018D3A5C4|nr:DUF1345 domain-containing protein [Tsukamurella tyrosinosolvens]MEC4614286.1 DUF1345 domain-containing protein [Tsukamurella tyrosinosolvens]QRY83184.1 DUF1345 domain-containing protein [Tsukamurella tyrosinosolvens]